VFTPWGRRQWRCAPAPSSLSIFANVETATAHDVFMQAWRQRPDGLVDVLAGLRTDAAGVPPWRFGVITSS